MNIGLGSDVTIRELVEIIQGVSGFQGRLVFDSTRPDGVPRKLLDVSRLRNLGWQAKVGLEDGIRKTWEQYRRS